MSELADRRFKLTVENANNREVLSIEPSDDGSEFYVWLGLDHDSIPEFIIGVGPTEQAALDDASDVLERLSTAIQTTPYPQGWTENS